jgi:acyl-CoA thioesterase-1
MTLKKLSWILGPLLLAAAGYWWWNRLPAPANLPPTAKGPWVAFGDSLTEGHGASEGNDYPSLLSRRLDVPIVNLGHGGDTTTDALQRIDAVTALHPRVVLLCFGGNDALMQEPRARTFANLAAIIDHLHAEGSFVVLIGIRSASLRDHNEKHFERLAREKRVFYVPDFLEGVAFNPVYLSDAIHPNDEGYKRVVDRLEKLLKPLLPRLGERRVPAMSDAPIGHAKLSTPNSNRRSW